jgi:hypothetical protein
MSGDRAQNGYGAMALAHSRIALGDDAFVLGEHALSSILADRFMPISRWWPNELAAMFGPHYALSRNSRPNYSLFECLVPICNR